MAVVIDSSYAMALVLPDEEPPATASEVLTSELIAPQLFAVEVANSSLNSVRRKRYRSEEALRVCEAIELLGIVVRSGPDFGPTHSLHLAQSYGLSAYDASYVELALLQRATLATCDLAMADAARKLGLQVFD